MQSNEETKVTKEIFPCFHLWIKHLFHLFHRYNQKNDNRSSIRIAQKLSIFFCKVQTNLTCWVIIIIEQYQLRTQPSKSQRVVKKNGKFLILPEVPRTNNNLQRKQKQRRTIST